MTLRGHGENLMGVDYINLGKRIKYYRERAHLTQIELADKSGLSRSFIGRMETGSYNASLESVVAVANALKITIGELLVDSMEETGSVNDSEVAFILLDCSPEEEKILAKNMKDLRETIRPYNIK